MNSNVFADISAIFLSLFKCQRTPKQRFFLAASGLPHTQVRGISISIYRRAY